MQHIVLASGSEQDMTLLLEQVQSNSDFEARTALGPDDVFLAYFLPKNWSMKKAGYFAKHQLLNDEIEQTRHFAKCYFFV